MSGTGFGEAALVRDRLGHVACACLRRRHRRTRRCRARAPVGVGAIRDGDFGGALARLLGDWTALAVPRVASGMIGSRQGWVEAPYVTCSRRRRLGSGGNVAHAWRGARGHSRGHRARRGRHPRRDPRRGDAGLRRGPRRRARPARGAARNAQQVGARRARSHRRVRDAHDRRAVCGAARRTACSAGLPTRRTRRTCRDRHLRVASRGGWPAADSGT